jgi:uncharacterized protein
VQTQLLDDAADFLRRAEPLLLADEARHNLIFGIAGTLRDHPTHYPEHRLWLVVDGDAIVGAALRTPPYNLVVAGRETALEALALELDEELPGVVGAVPEIEAFADAWEARWGAAREVTMAQGIYALEELVEPARPPGAHRPATVTDRELLSGWLRDFGREALPNEDFDEAQNERVIESRLSRTDAGFVIWEDGDPVSLAGYGGTTPHGTRIGPVYTPPEHRGRGYGSAVTAAVSAERLAAGRRFCFLYTDRSNPISNRIYVALGYRRVCDSLALRFV